MIIALVAASYLLGSIPVAWLITELSTGRDLRQLGSGNVGVMNTALTVHRWAGLVVFATEVLKGALAVIMAQTYDGSPAAIGLCVLAAFAGTRWSIWLKFRGGRGNTMAVAALALVSGWTVVAMTSIYLAARFGSHSNFIAMRVSLLLLPFVFGLVTQSWWWTLFGACFSLMFLTTHRPESDDHLLLKARWPTLWAFLTAPRRK
jgi:acyl phosphate:glycerol-3-phosphate acyltransferase